jgi:squalene synthase HpnC
MASMLAERTADAPTLKEAYAQCRRIALGHYENFPVVSAFLPRDLRRHIYAVYAYCRGVDDLGDEAEGDRLMLLNDWEAELRRCYEGEPTDPRFVALADTIRRFDIPREPFERLIEANRRDQRVKRYETFDELLEYCGYSANPVGHLVLYVFGYRDAERQALSDATCTALQLANFWQDVSVDIGNGRIYIPREDLEAFGVDEMDVLTRRPTRAFRRLMEFEVQRTRDYFRRGLPLIDTVAGRFRVDLRMFTLSGLAVLREIERRNYDVLTERPRLSRLDKASLLARALLRRRIEIGAAP